MTESSTPPPGPSLTALRERITLLRTQNVLMPLIIAWIHAHTELAPPSPLHFPFLAGFTPGQPITATVDAFTVTVRTEPDFTIETEDGFTNEFQDGCIRATVNPPGDHYTWYRPSDHDLHHIPAALRRAGMSKSVAHDTHREILHHQMHDAATRSFVVVIATAYRHGRQVGVSSEWGIYISPDHDRSTLLVQMADSCTWEAIEEAKTDRQDPL